MSEQVDELFGKGGDSAAPRTGLALGLLGVGLFVAILGGLCTSIPGGMLVLLAWVVVQRDLDRVESGFLPVQHLATIRGVRVACGIGIVLVIGLEMFQASLYSGRWDAVLGAVLQWFLPEGPAGPPPVP